MSAHNRKVASSYSSHLDRKESDVIDKREILDMATRVNLNPHVVEKDYALGWVLAGISAHAEIADTWLFKGGTCLKKCFFETYRFSEDLDFTLRDPAHLNEAFLKRVFAEIGAWVYEQTGLELPADQQDFEIYQNPRGTRSCQGKISYFGPVSSRAGGLPRIKLDLTADERVVLEPVRAPVFHPYSDAPADGIEILAYDYVEAFAEKFRALAERTRPRDLYDVVNLYRNIEARPEPVHFREVLTQKCAFKGIVVPRLADLEPHRNDLEAGWANMLAHQLPALLPVQSFWDEMPAIFEWLAGTATPIILAAAPIGAGETVIRERMVAMPAGSAGQSHIEIIRFAAANRLIVELDYRDKEGKRSTRAIEAYSLRRTQKDDILLMSVREADGQLRAYRLDSILGVAVTNRTFLPRYPIELSPSGPQSIPHTQRPTSSTAAYDSRSNTRHLNPARTAFEPRYIYRCTRCQREFERTTRDGKLRAHKDPAGYDCRGRHAIYVETRY
jgi:predicted nucleotidyltransferase component of viral defense system